jgi:hypothetical protein
VSWETEEELRLLLPKSVYDHVPASFLCQGQSPILNPSLRVKNSVHALRERDFSEVRSPRRFVFPLVLVEEL